AGQRSGRSVVIEGAQDLPNDHCAYSGGGVERGAVNVTHVRNMPVNRSLAKYFGQRFTDLFEHRFDANPEIDEGCQTMRKIAERMLRESNISNSNPRRSDRQGQKLTNGKVAQFNEELLDGLTYSVSGISCIIHPFDPQIPSIHFNFRYFEIKDASQSQYSDVPQHSDIRTDREKKLWWFGGGMDLTPYFIDQELFQDFHRSLKDSCDSLDPQCYLEFKNRCDQYFYLKHRKEHRGIGGIFFDDLNFHAPFELLKFVKKVSYQTFFQVYAKQFEKCARKLEINEKLREVAKENRQWQLMRRGRYVEFNLIYDRGTQFGLATLDCNPNLVLVSMPALCTWKFDEKPKNEEQKSLIDLLKNPKNWI
ncbi:MAG: hypothetical protein MHMPM18_001679, partial [Marteilia pararefringens]